MAKLTIMSLNGEDMIELVPKDLSIPAPDSIAFNRGRLIGQLITLISPDVVGLVEAPPDAPRTEKFVSIHLADSYNVYQGDKRGTLGLAFLVRKGLNIKVQMRTKAESLAHFQIKDFDADGDGIKELYSWANRVPFEAVFSGSALKAPVTFILVHSKSKGAFLPGDLFAYERLSRANRMKLKAQAAAVRKRLDALVDEKGRGRVVVMGDMNDGPEFDAYAALLGGAFLEPIMGSVWDPKRVFHNAHTGVPKQDRWTIDFKDRVVNPLEASKYGAPTELRSWIDHILLSPELRDSVVKDSAHIFHQRPKLSSGAPAKFRNLKPTDHHPPYVTLDL
ncbi:MAG: endonuclease/exonuclease/phosphatase family protein [Candidatus Aminicenantales bacterium]